MNQIRSAQLSDVMIVVVRYFGGTKLGVPGLINAYKTAASLALTEAQTYEVFLKRNFMIEYAYNDTQAILRVLDQFQATVRSQHFDESCHQEVSINESRCDEFREALASLRLDTLRWEET